ncbi:MAG: guanylate kinase [Planctomycetes bacterium]|nr:guanylate kinase [Planctomycetota bacterium]
MGAQGIFFLLAGPTAAGKTVVLKRLLETSEGLVKNISVTTRPPRVGEMDGRDYRFWEQKAFETEKAAGGFLESALVHAKYWYGTLKRDIDANLSQGLDVIKDIDVQGVELVRKALPYPQSVAIFMVPPSLEELRERFQKRGSEDDESLKRRLKSAEAELKRVGEYDYVVVNKDVEEAVADLAAIRQAEHLKRSRGEVAFRKAWGV